MLLVSSCTRQNCKRSGCMKRKIAMSHKIRVQCIQERYIVNCYSLLYMVNRGIEQCIHVAKILLDCRHANNTQLKFTSFKAEVSSIKQATAPNNIRFSIQFNSIQFIQPIYILTVDFIFKVLAIAREPGYWAGGHR